MINEMWKDVVGYEGKYQVSDQGKIRQTKSKRVLKASPGGRGYPIVQLHCNGIPKTVFLHRLIALAFLGKPSDPALIEVHHKNANKTDARLANLQWTTPRHNYEEKMQNMEWIRKHNDAIRCSTIEYMI